MRRQRQAGDGADSERRRYDEQVKGGHACSLSVGWLGAGGLP